LAYGAAASISRRGGKLEIENWKLIISWRSERLRLVKVKQLTGIIRRNGWNQLARDGRTIRLATITDAAVGLHRP
jgi:hypothetical protein